MSKKYQSNLEKRLIEEASFDKNGNKRIASIELTTDVKLMCMFTVVDFICYSPENGVSFSKKGYKVKPLRFTKTSSGDYILEAKYYKVRKKRDKHVKMYYVEKEYIDEFLHEYLNTFI